MRNATCDNQAVGVLVRQDVRLLFVERKGEQPGFGPPTGHLDGRSALEAAARTLEIHTGLLAEALEVRLVTSLPGPCAPRGRSSHAWMIVEAVRWRGSVRPPDGPTEVFWADEVTVADLAERLEQFAVSVGISSDDVAGLLTALQADPDWRRNPGLDPWWLSLLKASNALGSAWEKRPHLA